MWCWGRGSVLRRAWWWIRTCSGCRSDWTDEEHGPKKDRAGFDTDYSAGEMDHFFAPVDMARAASVQRAQAEVRGVQPGAIVLFEGQDELKWARWQTRGHHGGVPGTVLRSVACAF